LVATTSFSRGLPFSHEPTMRSVALGLGARRHRVHFGGINEIDALLKSKIQLRMTVGLGVLLTKSHRTQAHGRNLQITDTKLAVFHRTLQKADQGHHG
jgi:hypothetical protein